MKASLFYLLSHTHQNSVNRTHMDQTGAELSNIPDYQMVPKFLQIVFCYCYYTSAVQLIRGVFHLDISLVC